MKDDKLLGNDPLSETDLILTEQYYGRGPRAPQTLDDGARRPRRGGARPTHYKVICISMYTRDIEELEAKVAELKRRGWTKANKSQLIRLALAQLDLDALQTPPQ
jgi:hypothetical protein